MSPGIRRAPISAPEVREQQSGSRAGGGGGWGSAVKGQIVRPERGLD